MRYLFTIRRTAIVLLTIIWSILTAATAVGQNALFIASEDPGSFSSGDQATYAKLQAMGLTVTVRGSSANPAATADTAGMDIIMISSSINSGDINTKFKDVVIPVIVAEAHLWDDMKMVASSNDFGTLSNQSSGVISESTHFLGAPLTGENTLTTSARSFFYGEPGAKGTIIVHKVGNANKALVFVYEAGEDMHGMTAPAIRIGLFSRGNVPSHLNTDGWRLFENAVNYALGNTGVSSSPRVSDDLVALYTFQEGNGVIVNDISGVGSPADLSIQHLANVTWENDHGLTLNSATILKATSVGSAKIRAALMATNALTIEAWIQPANITQDGPARIVSLSSDIGNRNFTLGQEDDEYATRMRTNTSAGDNNGMPSEHTSAIVSTGLQHLVWTRDANGNVKTYINGSLEESSTRGGDFSNWDSNHLFVLGNETSMDRTWLGTYHLVAVYDEALDAAGVTQNFDAGPDGDGQNGTSNTVADGTIRFDRYDNISGSTLNDLTNDADYPQNPDHTTYLTTFEIPKDVADNYGSRVSGYVCPPATGNYTFWIASDDHSQLLLSTDSDPANATQIAHLSSWTGAQEWDKFSSQESAPVYLVAGQCYYIEALHKEGGGGDNLAVGWQLPDGTMDRPISGTYLSSVAVGGGSSSGGAQNITCELERYKFDEHAIWISGTNGANGDYHFESGFGKLEQFEDGTATLEGRVVNKNDANKKWDVKFQLVNRRNYDDWTALGRGVKGGHLGDESTWYYYELKEGESYMTGLGDFAGKTISLSQKPSDMHYAFQLGDGANDKNHNYGFSGWFYISGDYTGHGDVNTNATCYEREPEIVEECDILNYDNSQNRWVWMNDDNLGTLKYAWEAGKEGKFIRYSDGSINFKGCIVSTTDSNKKWDIDVWYTNQQDWATWSANGGDNKVDSWHTAQPIAHANYQHWMYYTIDDTRSTFTGKGTFAGETINLKKNANATQYGLQVGIGANDFTADFGASAWWEYTGDRTGKGDFNMNLNCGTAPVPTGPDDFYFTCLDGVEVKVYGKGTKGSTSANLSIANPEFVDSVIVEVVSKGGTPNPSVTFSNEEGQTITALARTVDNSPNGNSCSNCRTYRAVLSGSSKVYASNLNTSNAYSFVAYAFCSGTGNNQSSTGKLIETYFYKGDETFNLPLNSDTGPRDITVVVPITELNNDSRVAIIYATAGGVSVTETFQVPNLGTSLNITPFQLLNVPGNVTQLTIKIESPKGSNPYGDSFVVGGYAFATTVCNETCVLTDGGTVTGDQFDCEPFDPAAITSTSLPTGGNGTYEYEWRYTEDTSLPFDQWVVKEGANGPDLDLEYVHKTCYLVRLARKPSCEEYEAASNIIAIEVRKQPTAAFALPINICAGFAREFTSTYNGADSYEWDFASASPATASGQTIQSVQWNSPGAYMVRLIVDRQGCTDTLEQQAMVDDCTVCQNFTNGGAIVGSAATCTAPYDPAPITDFESPSGGGNGAVEYLWLKTVNPNLPPNQWTPIANSNSATYDPGVITQTTYYLRCARRGGCGGFLESNVVTVEISENVETLCEASRFSDAHYALQLDNYKVGTANGWYKFQGTSGTFTTYTDGSAKVEGLLEHTENPNQKWFASIWYVSKKDWGNWSEAGGKNYPSSADGTIDQMSWDYYVMDASRSKLVGFDMFGGDTLFLSHHPLNEVLGFQVGVGANGQNPGLGAYGRFAFSGSATGRGRVRINLENCRKVCSGDPLIASKVLFEGLYDQSTDEMKTDRNVFGMLPLNQPFNVYPYFYAGTETVASIPNSDIVDWVLVEARDETNPQTIISRQAVFVLKNGELRGLDGVTLPVLDVPAGVPYFISIRSLNHLDIRSGEAKDQMGRAFLHDFRVMNDLNNEAWIPNDPANSVNTDHVGAPSGDLNGDGYINAVDFAIISTSFFFFGYHVGDVDGNGFINAIDYQLVLKNYFFFQHN